MLGVAMYTTIETLYKLGMNKSEIARSTGHDWKTVNKVIHHAQSGNPPKKKSHPSQLDAYKEVILAHLESNLSGVRIHELLKAQGCCLSYSSVRNYISQLKGQHDICIRFHSMPGEEAQVDFGYVGKLPSPTGKIRKAWVFNMRLSYSRLDYYHIVFDQRVETFIDCHMHAFRYFNGIPSVVKIDNLKSAILKANFYQPVYQSYYKCYADYHGFHIVPCRVCQPQEKGKVESGIKYVKRNFFAGRQFSHYAMLQSELENWLNHYCNARCHGTTRRVPRTLFEEKERAALIRLPEKPFRHIEVGQRKVYRDCHVYIEYNYYSVPFAHVGNVVDIEMDEHIIRIFYDGQKIAVHKRLSEKGQFSTIESHYPQHKCVFSSCSKQRLSDKMKIIGEHAHRLFMILVEKQPHHWYRTTQGILSLQKKFDMDVIERACNRALSYGAIRYQQIKSICESGSYRLPISHEEKVH